MMKFVFLVILLLSLSLFVRISRAQSIYGSDVDNIISLLTGIPPEDVGNFFAPPGLIYNFFLPLIALVAISLGFMREIKIFESSPNIQTTIAVVMALSTIPLRLFYLIVSWSLQAMSVFAYFAFVLMFFIGGFIYSSNRIGGQLSGWKWYSRYKKSKVRAQRKLEKIRSEKANIQNKMDAIVPGSAGAAEKIAKLDQELVKKEVEEEDAEAVVYVHKRHRKEVA